MNCLGWVTTARCYNKCEWSCLSPILCSCNSSRNLNSISTGQSIVSSLPSNRHDWWSKKNKWSRNSCRWGNHSHLIHNVASSANSWVFCECSNILWLKSISNSVVLGVRSCDNWYSYCLRRNWTIVYKQSERSCACLILNSCDCSNNFNLISTNLHSRASLPGDHSRTRQKCNEWCQLSCYRWSNRHWVGNVLLSTDGWVFSELIDSDCLLRCCQCIIFLANSCSCCYIYCLCWVTTTCCYI